MQNNIQTLLKEQPQYVVNTSEFNDVKARLLALENRQKDDAPDPNRPTLKTGAGAETGEIGEIPGPRQRLTCTDR